MNAKLHMTLAALLAAPLLSAACPNTFMAVRSDDSESPVDDAGAAVQALKQGGYVVVFRHGASVSDGADEDPLVLGDCTKQRNLSSWGREVMAGLGQFLAGQHVVFGVAYSSEMCRAIDTAQRLTSAKVQTTASLTMLPNKSMVPTGEEAQHSRAFRAMVKVPPPAGTNTLLVTHAPNIVAAFGTILSGVQEGEAVVFQPNQSAPSGYEVRWRLRPADLASYARTQQHVESEPCQTTAQSAQ